jgi:hypothetical protein
MTMAMTIAGSPGGGGGEVTVTKEKQRGVQDRSSYVLPISLGGVVLLTV